VLFRALFLALLFRVLLRAVFFAARTAIAWALGLSVSSLLTCLSSSGSFVV
jgi:hypothetical protein